jgi:hypothetical protein
VELYNEGDVEVDASSLFLCNFPMYPTVGSLTLLGGNTTIPAGGFLVVAWADLGDTEAEVGLYEAGTVDFANAGAILDYMQYGTAGHMRETVAVAAGIWSAGEFVASVEAGKSLQFIVDPMSGEGEWEDRDPTPNVANSTATAIEGEGEVPGVFQLHANFPNPFNPTTTIDYDLNQAGDVQLSVYDMLGQKVADLYTGAQAMGSYSVTWDGRDEHGATVASGVYFYRLLLDGQTSQSRVMTLLK